ncbi:MAG: hypothetical protein ANABAC_2829 [Anaerolineae bacterium]|nr:MAG: hypothetical protein ANABAC_2829 [Anaerolineae bacterium]
MFSYRLILTQKQILSAPAINPGYPIEPPPQKFLTISQINLKKTLTNQSLFV